MYMKIYAWLKFDSIVDSNINSYGPQLENISHNICEGFSFCFYSYVFECSIQTGNITYTKTSFHLNNRKASSDLREHVDICVACTCLLVQMPGAGL